MEGKRVRWGKGEQRRMSGEIEMEREDREKGEGRGTTLVQYRFGCLFVKDESDSTRRRKSSLDRMSTTKTAIDGSAPITAVSLVRAGPRIIVAVVLWKIRPVHPGLVPWSRASATTRALRRSPPLTTAENCKRPSSALRVWRGPRRFAVRSGGRFHNEDRGQPIRN